MKLKLKGSRTGSGGLNIYVPKKLRINFPILFYIELDTKKIKARIRKEVKK